VKKILFPPPPSCEDQVKMLGAKAIFRMAYRSRDALIAFMRHYAPSLGTQDVLRCLLHADGNLQQAVRLLHKDGIGLGSEIDAFRAAIKSVDLPNETVRGAHLSFVASYGSARALFLLNCSLFHPSVLRCLGQNLPSDLQEHPIITRSVHELEGTSTSSPLNLSPVAYRALRLKMHSFRMEQELSLAIVHKALQKLALQLGVSIVLSLALFLFFSPLCLVVI